MFLVKQNFNLNEQLITFGTRLVRKKGGVVSRHHVVYVGYSNGIPMVVENQWGLGVRFIPLEQFLQEGELVRIEPFKGSTYQESQIVPRINECWGKSYNLTFFNCEHFATYILTGKKESKQVQNGVLIGALVIGALAISRNTRSLS